MTSFGAPNALATAKASRATESRVFMYLETHR
jgi:hypothetical protein